MSWSKLSTYNLLDRFQERTLQEVYKFNQIESDFNNYGQSVWVQAERDNLDRALLTNFHLMREWLGFYPRPIWKTLKIPLDSHYAYYDKTLIVPESAWLWAFGSRAVEVLAAGVAPTADGDMYRLTITTPLITDGELAIFHVDEDAFENTNDDRFRILPSMVYHDGTDYHIDIPKARFVKPVKWTTQYNNGDPLDRVTLEKDDSGNFAQTVNVCRVYNDPTTKARVTAPPFDFSSETTKQSQEVEVTVIDEQEASFKIKQNSFVTFDPYYVEIDAYIGYPLGVDGNMHQSIEEFIIRKAKIEMGIAARLAAAKISTQWDFDDVKAYEKTDLSSGRGGVGYKMNPIGARNVDVEMFKALYPIADWRGKITDQRFWS